MPTVVGVGLACLDVLIRCKEMPSWERGGRIDAFGFDGGGPVGTALVAVQKLGVSAGYLGTVGTDRVARLKLGFLTEYGVDVSRVAVREGPETQVVIVYVDQETGERTFAGVRRDGAGPLPLQVSELDQDYVLSADYLHLDGMNYEAGMQAARWMKEAGKTVVYDGHKTSADQVPDAVRAAIDLVDVLICGEGFGRALTGKSDLYEAGEAALDMGPRIVVQTEGANGSYTVTRDERFHVPAFQVPVVDTTGAGDVFHGAYIVGMTHGWPLRQVAQFATAVSAIKCTGLGGRGPIPSFPQVIAFLAERGIQIEE
ncbi:MAG: carbohydrate kinase family protein [Anaerolineae bacterium]